MLDAAAALLDVLPSHGENAMTSLLIDEISQACAACFFFTVEIEFNDGKLRLDQRCDQKVPGFPNVLECTHTLLLEAADEI
jgi:hypothetical protein